MLFSILLCEFPLPLSNFPYVVTIDFVQNGVIDVQDETHTNLFGFHCTIYLTIMSSLDFKECVHKPLKMEIKLRQEMAKASMLIEHNSCYSQEHSYQCMVLCMVPLERESAI